MDEYEKEIDCLKIHLMRINNYPTMFNGKQVNYDPTFTQCRLANQLLDERDKYQVFFQQIQEEFRRVEMLVTEANGIVNEMQEQVVYRTIVHIPVSYLKASERNMDNLCQVAIEVKHGDAPSSIWDIEKFELKLSEMRDIYHQWKTSKNSTRQSMVFFEENESEHLIGVANIYLKALFYHSKLDYIVPIINLQGERNGSVRVVLDQSQSSSSNRMFNDLKINSTTQGSISEGIAADIDEQSLSDSQASLEDEGIEEFSSLFNGDNEQITVKFSIKEIRDLPKIHAEHIICRYTFINPKLDQTIISSGENSQIYSFNHENEYTFPITDQFLSICREGAVSIEIYSQYPSKQQSTDLIDTEIREISRQWKDLKRHVQFSLEIHELDPAGQWRAVEVDPQEQIISGGIYRLKQGQSKRLVTQLRIIPRSDPMPLSFHAIQSVQIGSISTRKIDDLLQLDSYQDEDLKTLRIEWLNLIEQQKIYLESQVNLLNQQTNKTSNDRYREEILLEQLVRLAEERNIANFPAVGSGIPGAPAAWMPPLTIEMHRPLIFLDIKTSNETAGLRAILTEENQTKMLSLPLIQHASDEIRAVALWDPAIHESSSLNQVTPADTVIYLIVKITVLITEPVQMEIVLRKRIAVTISKTEGWWPGKTFKNLLGYKPCKRTSVVYEIVSMIPKTIRDANEIVSDDLIDKYLQHASTIDAILLLDRLRQEVLLAENCAKQQTIRKSTSVPNMRPSKRHSNLFHSPANSRHANPTLTESELTDSTPSMILRALYIEEEQIQPIQRISTFEIKNPIDLDDDREINDQNTPELKYLTVVPSLSTKEYSIDCRVIVNTGHTVVNKSGIIRFIGEISVSEGVWYGIELDESIGKNNGSIGDDIYFQCPDKHGLFVRRDKLSSIQ